MSKETLHGYRRVSSKIQSTEGDSLTTQLEIGKDWSNKLGMKYQDWNEGPQSSSKDDFENRPRLNRLLLHINQGKVKHLYVFDLDRLSRNEQTWFIIRNTIRDNKVKLYTRNGEMDLSNPTDNLLSGVLGLLSQFTNEQNKIRSQIGRENRVRQGKFPGGKPNFGYINIDKQYKINSDEKPSVIKMFKMYDSGKSIKDIQQMLTDSGLKPRHSSIWNTSTIQKMLENRIYVGEHVWKGIKIPVPEIISESLYDRVQKRIGKRYVSNNKQRTYLLTPLLTCGSCDSNFYGMINKKNGSQIYYCPSKQNKWRGTSVKEQTCSITKNINITRTDNLVWNTVLETVSSSVFMKEKFKKEILDQKKKTVSSVSDDIKKLDKRIKRLKKDEEIILKSISKVEVERLTKKIEPEVYSMMKDNLSDQLNGFRSKIQECKDEISMKNEEKGWVDWVSRFGVDLENKSNLSEEEKRTYLHEIIDRIIVTQSKNKEGHLLEIKFQLPIVKDSLVYKDKTNKRKGYSSIKDGSSEQKVELKHVVGGSKKKESKMTHMLNSLNSNGLS